MNKKMMWLAIAVGGIGLLFGQKEAPQNPDSTAKEVLDRDCSSCHDATVVAGERRSAEGWQEVIDDMVRRGADVSEEDRKTILAYLVKNFGKPPDKTN
jgi:hypothetical protein